MEPLLSVLMTAYNREQFITDAIDSVLNSTWQDFELIIVDDCSTDKTLSIAQSYAEKDKRIRVYQNEKNLGDYPNRNKAASYANGEFIMYVDSDDQILPTGFEDCINAMNQFSFAGFGMLYKEFEGAPFYLDKEEVIRKNFFDKSFLNIGPGGTILRRNFFEQIGKYPTAYGPANDMYFNLKASSIGGLLLLPFPFIFYRIHEGQELNNKYSYLYNNYNYLRDAMINLDLPLSIKERNWIQNKNRRRFIVNLLQYLKQTGDIRKAFEAAKKASFGWRDAFKGLIHPPL